MLYLSIPNLYQRYLFVKLTLQFVESLKRLRLQHRERPILKTRRIVKQWYVPQTEQRPNLADVSRRVLVFFNEWVMMAPIHHFKGSLPHLRLKIATSLCLPPRGLERCGKHVPGCYRFVSASFKRVVI